MTDVASALAPIMPIILEAAGTVLAGVAVLAVRQGLSILQHWFHISVTATQQERLEQAASNAAAAIVAKAPTGTIINQAFSVNDPRVQAAAKWIVTESVENAPAVKAIAVNVDDMAHKIIAKLGDKQVAMGASSAAVPELTPILITK